MRPPDPRFPAGRAATGAANASTTSVMDVEFRLEDPGSRLVGVRLWQQLGLPGEGLDFRRTGTGWSLRMAPPGVVRMEYLLELEHPGGGRELIRDPANPKRVDGPHGEHSVLEFPGYRAPWWLEAPAVHGERLELEAGGVGVGLWSPADAAVADPLPLLAVHDGPELDRYAQLTRYTGAVVGSGRVPPHRLALLAPSAPGVNRDERYAANEDYAAALAEAVIPTIRRTVAVTAPVVLAGVSLGGLAALHAEWRRPGTFGALFSQSGSFFTPELDPQESGYAWFGRITAFTAQVAAARTPPSRPRVALTCGGGEENAANNRAMATTLSRLGLASTLGEFADMHNFTAWRDALDPHLTGLLRQVWR